MEIITIYLLPVVNGLMWGKNMDKTAKIRQLNDAFRRTFIGGDIMLTLGIRMKSEKEVADILERVRTFNDFNKGIDPYFEHDLIAFSYKGEKVYAKIDYYDKQNKMMSKNPADPSITNRVMTIMLADEY